MKTQRRLWAVVLLASSSLFGQTAAELGGRWSWSASCKPGEAREGRFQLYRISEESFRGEFLGTGHQSDVIRRAVLAAKLHSLKFQREYVTATGEKGIERWRGTLSAPEGAKITWTGTLLDAETECSFKATKQ